MTKIIVPSTASGVLKLLLFISMIIFVVYVFYKFFLLHKQPDNMEVFTIVFMTFSYNL